MFYDLRAGAAIKNLNVKFDIEYIDAYVSALCYTVHNGAVIENCNATGNVKMVHKSKNSGMTLGGLWIFSRNNYGTIRNCTYTGNITKTNKRFLGQFDLGIFSTFDYEKTGVVENCTANCNIDIITPAYGSFALYGISQRAKNCTYNGNITIRDNSNTYKAAKVNIYGLGAYASDCTFNGDITTQGMSRIGRLRVGMTNNGALGENNKFNGKVVSL